MYCCHVTMEALGPREDSKLPVSSHSRRKTSNNICLISKPEYCLLKEDYEKEQDEDQEDGKEGRQESGEGERERKEGMKRYYPLHCFMCLRLRTMPRSQLARGKTRNKAHIPEVLFTLHHYWLSNVRK